MREDMTDYSVCNYGEPICGTKLESEEEKIHLMCNHHWSVYLMTPKLRKEVFHVSYSDDHRP